MSDKEKEKKERMQARRLERRAYSVQDVADMLGVSTDVVYRLAKAKKLPHKRLGERIVVPAPLFEKWLEQQESYTVEDLDRSIREGVTKEAEK